MSNVSFAFSFSLFYVIGYQYVGLSYRRVLLSMCRSVLTHLQRSGTGCLLVMSHHVSVLVGLVQHCLSADSQCSAARNEPEEFC